VRGRGLVGGFGFADFALAACSAGLGANRLLSWSGDVASLTPPVGHGVEGVIMAGTRWIKVDATIVECFRAWEEPLRSAHPRFEIVADITTPSGDVERVSSQQEAEHPHPSLAGARSR
jgi:hypothetical protein